MDSIVNHTERLVQFNAKEAELERALREVQSQRREYINRHNINKEMKEFTRG